MFVEKEAPFAQGLYFADEDMLFTGRDVPRAAPRGLMFLTLAKESANENETWIADMYEEAMRQASDDERGVALRMVEAWIKTVRR